MTAPYPNHNPIGSPRSVRYIIDTGFVDSSGGPIVSPSDKPTKYPSPVPIVNPHSVTRETPTKYPPHVPKEFPSFNPINILI